MSSSESEGENAARASTSNLDVKEKSLEKTSFKALGLNEQLCEACEALKFKAPTDIQKEAIPYALQGRDIIGLAQTGSGKTAAFALPILHALWEEPKPFFATVLAPTRELAYQISEQFQALGSTIGVRCAVLVGGMAMMDQSMAISRRPHIIVATPGRLDDHLQNTKGFSLRNLRYLVLDEADRLLDMDFGPTIDKILKVIPRERNTYLFSATMTTKVAKLQRASLSNPVKLEVSSKYATVSTLVQNYILTPHIRKDAFLVYLLTLISGGSSRTIIFTRTIADASRLAVLLRILSFTAVPLHGQLSQSARLGALNKFKASHGLPTEGNDEDGADNDGELEEIGSSTAKGNSVLVATDVASRGLDLPQVDYVINYDLPLNSKDYIHRVGRTARAGRSGKSVTLVSQYDVEVLQRIEGVIGVKLTEYPGIDKEQVAMLYERVGEAQREAVRQIRESELNDSKNKKNKKNKRKFQQQDRDDMDRDDDAVEAGSGGGFMAKGKKAKSRRR